MVLQVGELSGLPPACIAKFRRIVSRSHVNALLSSTLVVSKEVAGRCGAGGRAAEDWIARGSKQSMGLSTGEGSMGGSHVSFGGTKYSLWQQPTCV